MITRNFLTLMITGIFFNSLVNAQQISTLSESERLRMLEPPGSRVRMVLDTDTYNEIDDQFAVVYALLSTEKLDVEAIYAAPFHNNRSDDFSAYPRCESSM